MLEISLAERKIKFRLWISVGNSENNSVLKSLEDEQLTLSILLNKLERVFFLFNAFRSLCLISDFYFYFNCSVTYNYIARH